jgi:hypothetical protein
MSRSRAAFFAARLAAFAGAAAIVLAVPLFGAVAVARGAPPAVTADDGHEWIG